MSIYKYSFFNDIFKILVINIKNVGKSISSGLDDQFKYVFRILITSLDQLVCLAKNTSKILCRACVRLKQKIAILNTLNSITLPEHIVSAARKLIF